MVIKVITVNKPSLFCNISCNVLILFTLYRLLLRINVKKKLPLEIKDTLQTENGISVSLRLYINSNEVCNTAYAL